MPTSNDWEYDSYVSYSKQTCEGEKRLIIKSKSNKLCLARMPMQHDVKPTSTPNIAPRLHSCKFNPFNKHEAQPEGLVAPSACPQI